MTDTQAPEHLPTYLFSFTRIPTTRRGRRSRGLWRYLDRCVFGCSGRIKMDDAGMYFECAHCGKISRT